MKRSLEAAGFGLLATGADPARRYRRDLALEEAACGTTGEPSRRLPERLSIANGARHPPLLLVHGVLGGCDVAEFLGRAHTER